MHLHGAHISSSVSKGQIWSGSSRGMNICTYSWILWWWVCIKSRKINQLQWWRCTPSISRKKVMAIIESRDKDYCNIINYNVTSMSWRCCQTLLQWVSTHTVLHHQASQKALDTSKSWQDQEEASSLCCRYWLHLEVGSSKHLCSMLYW